MTNSDSLLQLIATLHAQLLQTQSDLSARTQRIKELEAEVERLKPKEPDA